jgi:hypothetical protein
MSTALSPVDNESENQKTRKDKLSMPAVSVIIPTYNRAEFLRLAITSVLTPHWLYKKIKNLISGQLSGSEVNTPFQTVT